MKAREPAQLPRLGSESPSAARICLVEDDDALREVLSEILIFYGYRVFPFTSATEFLEKTKNNMATVDLILSDVAMPGSSGFELCRAIRERQTSVRIPIVLMTGHDGIEGKRVGLETGADDLLQKPVRKEELLAKVRSLLKIREEQMLLVGQLHSAKAENGSLAKLLEGTERKARGLESLKQFVSPRLAELAVSGDPNAILPKHSREVSVLFTDLRRFTSFSEEAAPVEVLKVLEAYYSAVGNLAMKLGGTIGHLAGDGIMVFFSDTEAPEAPAARAVELAVAAREQLNAQKGVWQIKGYDLDFGIGIASGYATIGGIGFGQFRQYSVIGPVANLASRLCQSAEGGQILVPGGILPSLGGRFRTECVGQMRIKGLKHPVETHDVRGKNSPR
jgi:adenylate cyclase